MTLLTALRSTARRTPSALVVTDERSCDAALRALDRAVDVATAVVTVAALPLRDHPVCVFAPMSGLTTDARMREEAALRAHEAARRSATTMSAPSVNYRVARNWPHVTQLVAAGGFDLVVLGTTPRRSHLRRLVEIAGQAGSALIFARP
jgi:nucleotide-binding universal stress UspA family protein